MFDEPEIGLLATATGMHRRTGQHDPTGFGIDHNRVVGKEIGLLMTQIDAHVPKYRELGGRYENGVIGRGCATPSTLMSTFS